MPNGQGWEGEGICGVMAGWPWTSATDKPAACPVRQRRDAIAVLAALTAIPITDGPAAFHGGPRNGGKRSGNGASGAVGTQFPCPH